MYFPSQGSLRSASEKSRYCEQLRLWRIYWVLAKGPTRVGPILTHYSTKGSFQKNSWSMRQSQQVSRLLQNCPEIFLGFSRASQTKVQKTPTCSVFLKLLHSVRFPLWDCPEPEGGPRCVFCGRWRNASLSSVCGVTRTQQLCLVLPVNLPNSYASVLWKNKNWKIQKQKENNLTTICPPATCN